MPLYGSSPGVSIRVRGGGISNVAVGREQKLVVFGRGNPQEGTASVNSAEKVETRLDASSKFGDNTELSDGLLKALSNGANNDYLYGVMPESVSVTGESVQGDGGTLSNAPIVEDISSINVIDDSDSTDETINFVYEDVPEAPSDPGVNINPLTGGFEADDGNTYTVDYEYLDWQSALDAADSVLIHNEVGIYAPLSDASSVAQKLVDKLDELRPTYKLIRGVMGAQPNYTGSEGRALINADTYVDSVDDAATFLLGPVREREGHTAIGAAAGVFAGHDLTNPVYGDSFYGVSRLNQTLTRQEEGQLRDAQVIPVQDNAGDGERGITMEDNTSTSTETDWPRDFHRRRIVDQVILVGRTIGEDLRDERLIDDTLIVAEENFLAELENFVDAGLIKPNPSNGGQQTGTEQGQQQDQNDQQNQTGQQDKKYFVEITRGGTDSVEVAVGITPVGIVKTVTETITINTG